jgi:hypothetical protein
MAHGFYRGIQDRRLMALPVALRPPPPASPPWRAAIYSTEFEVNPQVAVGPAGRLGLKASVSMSPRCAMDLTTIKAKIAAGMLPFSVYLRVKRLSRCEVEVCLLSKR